MVDNGEKFTIITKHKNKNMSGIKRTLDETWYEYSSRAELHWMEQEYLHLLSSKITNNNNYDNIKK